MTLSMYQASVPVFTRGFKNLSAILAKAAAHSESKKIAGTVFTTARLAPDMFELSRQVQIATDIVKGGIARLAGVEIPKFEDTETTFEELQARIAKTIKFVETVKPAQIDGTEGKEIILKVGGQDIKFTGQSYLLNFVVPNFYFHMTTTYAILRHNNVEIGKKDFLGAA